MTEWRDARLAQALAHAPDDGMRPADAVRAAVRDSAHRAVAGQGAAVQASPPLWRRAWDAMGRSGSSWNAAFATVLLACLVTVLWWDKPVPEAAVDRPSFKAPEKSVAPPAAPTPAPAPQKTPAVPAPAAVPGPAPAPDLGKRAMAKPQPAPPVVARPAPVVPAAPPPAPAPAQAAVTQAAPAEARPDAAVGGAAARAKAAPAPSSESAAVAAPDTAPPPAPGAAPAAAPAAAAAPPALRREAAPFARDMAESSNRASAAAGLGAAQPAAQAPLAATRAPQPLLLILEGRPLAFTTAQAQQIESLVQALAAQATTSEPLQSRVVATVRRLRDPASAGTLQLAPPQVRWQPARPGAQALTGRPDAAQLQELLEALQQLPAR